MRTGIYWLANKCIGLFGGYEWLINDNSVLISLIAFSINHETAVTFTRGYFNKVVFAITFVHIGYL